MDCLAIMSERHSSSPDAGLGQRSTNAECLESACVRHALVTVHTVLEVLSTLAQRGVLFATKVLQFGRGLDHGRQSEFPPTVGAHLDDDSRGLLLNHEP